MAASIWNPDVTGLHYFWIYLSPTGNVATDTAALQELIDYNAPRGIPIRIKGAWVVSGLVMKTGMILEAKPGTTITVTSSAVHALYDNNLPVTDVYLEGIKFISPSNAGTNRAIFFDADTANVTREVKIYGCEFERFFRGIEADRIQDLDIDTPKSNNLRSVLLYIGESVATGQSETIRVRNPYMKDNGGADTEGGLIIAYARDIVVEGASSYNCGATSGAINLYHALYFRSCEDAEIRNFNVYGQKRGAGVHVFSDLVALETHCKRIKISAGNVYGSANYAGVRCSGVRDLTIEGVTSEQSYFQGFDIDQCDDLKLVANTAKNNNRQKSSGALASAGFYLYTNNRWNVIGCTGVDDITIGGEYGQGAFVALGNNLNQGAVQSNRMKFGTGIGYYFSEVLSGATVTDLGFTDNTMDGASSFINEVGTGTRFSFFGNKCVNNGSATFLTAPQLAKWASRGNWNQGTRIPTGSES